MSGTPQEAQSFKCTRLSVKKIYIYKKINNLSVKRRRGSAKRCTKTGQSDRTVCVGNGSGETTDRLQIQIMLSNALRDQRRMVNGSVEENRKIKGGTPVGQSCRKGSIINIGEKEKENVLYEILLWLHLADGSSNSGVDIPHCQRQL